MAIWVSIIMIIIISTSVQVAGDLSDDVAVLKELYKSLNQPKQLVNWNPKGTHPCKESWIGISCIGPSVVSIQLSGLKLNGSLRVNFGDLSALNILDLSSNEITGEVPSSLPPTLTQLNLSNNLLSGSLNDAIGSRNLRIIDFSSNNLSGNLPGSFNKLTKLHELYLQNNSFSGSLGVLGMLPLQYLYAQLNDFSGDVSERLLAVPHLKLEGNDFDDDIELPIGGGAGDENENPSSAAKNATTRVNNATISHQLTIVDILVVVFWASGLLGFLSSGPWL